MFTSFLVYSYDTRAVLIKKSYKGYYLNLKTFVSLDNPEKNYYKRNGNGSI
jgi:hypothetical protein